MSGSDPARPRSRTWVSSEPPPVPPPPGPAGWLRVALRGLAVGTAVFGGLWLHAMVGLWDDRMNCGDMRRRRRLTRAVCRAALRGLGIPLSVTGTPLSGPGAVVANHASWLDILALNAAQEVTFVAKAEVRGWPGIGRLARATGTVFVRRDSAEAPAQAREIAARLRDGARLLLFPEGTSSDGQRVLPFNPTLFQPFLDADGDPALRVQPVSVIWSAPPGRDARFYGWWGDMALAPHLVAVLAAPRQGAVEVVLHPPVRPRDAGTRKELARRCEAAVRAGVEARLAQARPESADV